MLLARRPPLLARNRGRGAGRGADDGCSSSRCATSPRSSRWASSTSSRCSSSPRSGASGSASRRRWRARWRSTSSTSRRPAGFAITGGENWVALVVFFLAAALTSSLTEVARRRATEAEQRRQEADLAAEMARLLLRGGRLEETLPAVSERLARAFALPSASITATAVPGTFPLREGAAPDRDAQRRRAGGRPAPDPGAHRARRWSRCWPPRWSATR